MYVHGCVCSTQHATTYIKKVIEDNCTMEETVRFLAVSQLWLLVFISLMLLLIVFVVLLLGELAILYGCHQRTTNRGTAFMQVSIFLHPYLT